MDPSGRWRQALNGFLFQPVDARAAAWFRMAFAVALPWFFWSRGLRGPDGATAPVRWLYEHVFLSFGYWLAVLALCVPMAWGWRPRLVGCLLVLVLLPLDFLSVGSTSRLVMLFALLAFSCVRSDAVRIPWRASDRSRLHGAGPSWPVRLMQLQLTLLYGANAIAKSSPSYLRGDVLMDYSIALPNFRVDLSGGMLELGPVAVPVVLAAVASAFTEYFLAIGFWFGRWKWITALVGLGFHFSLTFIVQIFMLHYATVFLYLAFLLPLVGRNVPAGHGGKTDPAGGSGGPGIKRRMNPAASRGRGQIVRDPVAWRGGGEIPPAS